MLNQRCMIHDYNGEPSVSTSVFQLLQWKHALQLEINHGISVTGDANSVSKYLRKRLQTPRNYKKEWLLQHVVTSLEDVTEQLRELGESK